MNKLKMIFAIAALGFIFVCAQNGLAQQPPDPQITGGYGSVSVKDKEVVAAANFAVKAEAKKTGSKIKLVSIKCAEQQVVAGMNYRVHLKVQITRRGKTSSQNVEAVVYKNLKQKYSLTGWTNGDCHMP